MSSLAFFSSSASSFHPAPYTPASSSRPTPRPSRSSNDVLAVPPQGMDPQPTDPDVLFIRPPFDKFPDSHLHPDGLTYSVMAENPEWFLDALDFFVGPTYSLKSPMPYPPHLEPPRGWCPAKKKDLKDRGPDGWPEGEEPRLRCTFCRRTYAGVNAKSMWRRHVFEKHKIPMSNRRDTNTDRSRGRGSNKENRNQPVSRPREDTHDSLVTMVVAPQTAPEVMSHKSSRFRTTKLVNETTKPHRTEIKKNPKEHHALASTSQISREDHDPSESSGSENDYEPPARNLTPPLTPHANTSSDPANVVSSNSDDAISVSPSLAHLLVPESPYNPLQTPSFRHSPPSLPSDHPWRFPSPSHPLHSSTRDLSLAMVARPLASPVKKGLSQASPSMTLSTTMLALNSSPISSPAPSSKCNDGERSALSGLLFPRPTNISQFLKYQCSFPPISSPKQDSLNKQRLPVSSPFRTPFKTVHKKQSSEYSDPLFSEDSLATPSKVALTTSDSDPFSIYDSWLPIDDGVHISPVRFAKAPLPLEGESPVLRSGALPSIPDLEIGLLEPFFSKEDILSQLDADLNLLSTDKIRPDGKRRAVSTNEDDVLTKDSPPLKKRRKSPDGSSEA